MVQAGVVYVAVGLATTAALLVYAIYIVASTRRMAPSAWVLLTSALWTCAAALEHALPGLASKVVADRIQYAGLAFLPAAWLLFCLSYGRVVDRVEPRIVLSVVLLPAILFGLALTNEYHGFLWAEPQVLVGDALAKTRRWGFWVLVGCGYVLLATGLVLLVRLTRSKTHVFGRQIRALVLAALFPFLAGILDLIRIPGLGVVDLTPLALAGTMLIVIYGFARLGFSGSVPVAHRVIVQTMADPVVIVDSTERILYRNPAAVDRLGLGPGDPKGRLLESMAPAAHTSIREAMRDASGEADLSLGSRRYHVQVTPLRDWREVIMGHIAVLRDVTTLRAAEARLREVAAQEELARSAKEKEVLLRELHHRTRNHLQIITSLLRLQLTRAADDASRRALEGAETRIRAMATMHELLDARSAGAALGAYLERVARVTLEAYGRPGIRLDFDLAQLVVEDRKATVCGLILNELLSNALKHAYAGDREGTVRVILSRVADGFRLAVRDDGVGMGPEAQTPSAGSLGLLIVRLLASQLDGEVAILREGGTEVSVSFPWT